MAALPHTAPLLRIASPWQLTYRAGVHERRPKDLGSRGACVPAFGGVRPGVLSGFSAEGVVVDTDDVKLALSLSFVGES